MAERTELSQKEEQEIADTIAALRIKLSEAKSLQLKLKDLGCTLYFFEGPKGSRLMDGIPTAVRGLINITRRF